MAVTPGTLGYMKQRIANELQRQDFLTPSTVISDAINDAISAYADDRFRFNDIDPAAPPTFNTVVGQSVYGSAANANIATAYKIDYVLINVSNTVQYLVRREPLDVKLYLQNNTMRGVPAQFAYEGNSLIIAPLPDTVYMLTLGILRNVAAPATDNEANNPWMTDGEKLIRSRAKFEIATHVTRNPTMAAAMSPDLETGAAYREFINLKNVGNRITSPGRIRAMQF